MQGAGFAAVSRLLAPDSPQIHLDSDKRTHLSRLSTPDHGRLRRQQTGQATQIGREHRQREHVADLAPRHAASLAGSCHRAACRRRTASRSSCGLSGSQGSPDGGGTSVDAALALGSFAGLGVVFVGVLRDVRSDVALAAASTKPLVSKFLSAPTVLRCSPGRPFNISSAASCSAVPLASVSRVSTASLLRFSISTWPR